jgi:fibronectin type 3 domain-containing protein
MRIAIAVRTAGVCVALGAAALAACSGGGGAGAAATATATSSPAPTSGVTNATLSWAAPTENTNGSPVSALGGYRIYYGTASRQYTTSIDVSNPGLSTYVIDDLDIGVTYYFAIAAVTAAGVESALSPEVAVQIS